MIERENTEELWPMGQPTHVHALKEQMTLVRGWTQLVSSYSTEEWPRHEEDIRKGLTRIDTATSHLIELCTQVLPSPATTATHRTVE